MRGEQIWGGVNLEMKEFTLGQGLIWGWWIVG